MKFNERWPYSEGERVVEAASRSRRIRIEARDEHLKNDESRQQSDSRYRANYRKARP